MPACASCTIVSILVPDLKHAILFLAALVVAVAALIAMFLPPPTAPPMAADFTLAWPVMRGAYHVHSQRSDGTGTLDEIAAAAARAGLQFVIVTDHGDGTRRPEPPAYRSRVLCIDAVEISTDHGHYVALGLDGTPYPLAGHSRDVIEDVGRFGGFGFVAHPGSPKPALRWGDWDAPFDGLEWINADSEWRDELWGSLGRVLLTYAFRPTETLASLLDRPADVLQQWDRVARLRRVPALAGADAHARLGFRQTADPYEDRVLARLPPYEVSFRAFANHVILGRPLTGDASADAGNLLSSIREGRIFSSIDGLASLTAFDARATSGAAVARIGEYLEPEGNITIEAQITAPPGTVLMVVKDGVPIYDATSNRIRVDVGREPGAYRIEARLRGMPSSAAPWVLSNPMYLALAAVHAGARVVPAPPAASTRSGVATSQWRAESSEGSSSTLTPDALADGTPALAWRFQLAGGTRGRQYAAIRFPVDQGLSAHDRLQLRVASDAPRRVWAQIRVPGAADGQRWGRTFFVDESLRALELFFDDFRPLDTTAERPALDRIDSVLLVVDTLNTAPLTTGAIWIPDLWVAMK